MKGTDMRANKVIYGLLLAALLLVAAGCESGSSPSGKSKGAGKPKGAASGKPVASLEAGVLWEKFKENELQADTAYKDKIVEVSGAVTVVEKSQDGRYYVGILAVTPNMEYREPLGRYDRMVVGYIKDSQKKRFAALKRTDLIKIAGRVIGVKPNPTAYGGLTVELDDCWLVKKE